MKLAMEIPFKHLEEFSRVTDIDFALAHLVLDNKDYASFYAEQRKRKRRVILDNSMHELPGNKPLSIGEVIEAAKRINPSVVIPPDKLGDAAFTLENFQHMRQHPGFSDQWDLACVIQGQSPDERVNLFMKCRTYSQTLCLPYREPRASWFDELLTAVPSPTAWPAFLHLLGTSTLDELRWFTRKTEQVGWPQARVAMDTAKPIKWAIAGKLLQDLEDLRGGGLLDHTKQLDVAQRLRTYNNIAFLRRYMA